MNNLKKMLFAISVIVAVAGPGNGSAQTAQSLEQLQVIVKPGDNVWVRDSAGKQLKGRIDQLTASTLRLRSQGVVYDFTATDLSEVRHSDSLINGTLIGAGVGAGFGTLGLIAACFSDSCGWGAAFASSWTGVGALTGLGIDALKGRHKTIYRAPTSSPLTNVRISPLAGGKNKGVLLTFRF